jgi:hypothetical protein
MEFESIFMKSVGEKVCLLLIEFYVMEYSVILFLKKMAYYSEFTIFIPGINY